MRTTKSDVRVARPYEPIGSAKEILYGKDREMCAVGPAGTGKTRANLEKLNAVALKYPGSRCLILRKTRTSCTDTVLVTFEEHVVPDGSPITSGVVRSNRHSYRYPNGSEIVVGGMDRPTRILSSEYDVIYVAEAIELIEDEWETLLTRLRNNRVPYQQLISDTNPGAPTHWLKARIDRGDVREIKSRHEDNPALYDPRLGAWTSLGENYLATLGKLTGHRRKRFLEGIWSAAEGARWPNLDDRIHRFSLGDRFAHGIPREYRLVIGLDYGKAAPYAAIWVAIAPNGDQYVYREDYEAGLHASVQARRVMQRTKTTEKIHAIRADSACWAQPPSIDPWKREPSVADYYDAEFKTDKRFPKVVRGFKGLRVHAFERLDQLLDHDDPRTPNLFIERSCVNLWTELNSAVWHPDGREDIDDKCADHAITAYLYGTHTGEAPPAEAEKAPTIDDFMAAHVAERQRHSEAALEQFLRSLDQQ